MDVYVALLVAIVAIGVIVHAAVWIRGGRGWHIDEEIHVDAAPGTVFAILDEPEHAHALNPRLARIERVGDRIRHHVRHGRRDGWTDHEIVERRPPHRLVHEVVGGELGGRPSPSGTRSRVTFDLKPSAGGTLVRLSVRGTPADATARFLIGFVHGQGARAARAMLRRLRDYASAPARSS